MAKITYPTPKQLEALRHKDNRIPYLINDKATWEAPQLHIEQELEAMRESWSYVLGWGVDGIDTSNLDNSLDFELKSLSMGGVKLTITDPLTFAEDLNEDMTWRVLWQLSNALALAGGRFEDSPLDTIESFTVIGDGELVVNLR